MRTDIIKDVKDVYHRFFEDLEIDPETGHFKRDPQTGEIPNCNKKFATYPHIGSKYGESTHPKLLIVGLYRTKDEGEEHMGKKRIQSFEGRRQKIEVVNHPDKHNPHMAGTYMTALYYLQRESPGKYPEWAEYWKQLNAQATCQQLDDQATCQQLLKEKDKLPSKNPLSYIALTNYHKFVKPGGGRVKHFINKELEDKLLLDEVKVFAPDIIVLQSKGFSEKNPFNQIDSKYRLLIGPSPSARGQYNYVRKPLALIDQIDPYPGKGPMLSKSSYVDSLAVNPFKYR